MIILDTILRFKWIIAFYLIIVLFLFIKRKHVATQAKIIFLYRTKIGLKLMERISTRYREAVKLWGQIGVGVGFVGMLAISIALIYGIIALILRPDSAPSATLVLPGMNIPGIGVLPFWFWLIAIFIIAVVHEFSHGVVARAHKIPVKNTGLVLFGPIIGAFVEPDEKKMTKQPDHVQYSVYAAGPWANILLAIVALLLLNFVFMPLQTNMMDPTGFTFESYVNESLPFAQAGILPGTLITGINGESIAKFQEFDRELYFYRVGDEVFINTPDKDYTITLAAHPQDQKKGYLGIKNIQNQFSIREPYKQGIGKTAYFTLEWFNGIAVNGKGFLFWLYLLSLGIGLFNLLPLPIVDGGRMAQVAMQKLFGNKKGNRRFGKVALFFLIILVLSIIGPYILKLF